MGFINWIIKIIVDMSKALFENGFLPVWVKWLSFAGIFLFIELLHGSWILFWFAIGAGFAAVVSLLFPAAEIQVVSFFIASTLSLLFGRPLVQRVFLRGSEANATNIHSCIGRQEICIEDIDGQTASGAVKLFGTAWKARSADGCPISKNSLVRIVDVDGLCLVVELVAGPAIHTEDGDNEATEIPVGELLDD